VPDLTSVVWRKSSRSNNGGNCVEVATDLRHAAVLVRDSKRPADGVLAFSPQEWRAFTAGIRDGEFDL
jgi:Domain of unknown function (DUF397).